MWCPTTVVGVWWLSCVVEGEHTVCVFEYDRNEIQRIIEFEKWKDGR